MVEATENQVAETIQGRENEEEEGEEETKQKQREANPQISGIEDVADERVRAVINKVIDKVVRITVSDGRIYLGKLMSIDQTRTAFIQDALELIDREDEHYVEHELIAPHLLTRTPPGQRYFLKMVGNVVVPGQHIR